jgi:hypothetical protein
MTLNISTDDVAGIDVATQLKSVVGWNIGVSFIEQEPGMVKMSFRTRDSRIYDLSKVTGLLGGGGHGGAAGAQVKGTIDEAKKKVLKALQEAYPFLPKKIDFAIYLIKSQIYPMSQFSVNTALNSHIYIIDCKKSCQNH